MRHTKNDAEFLQALEHCTLPSQEFDHAAHVRAGYLHLAQRDFAGALRRLRRTIRRYAAHHGRPDRYHETITVACLALIQQCIDERGDGGGWEGFARDNPALLDPGLLRRFYPGGQLDSERARRIFLLPRVPLE